MQNYAAQSIETHLFFARIMKEHALFLEAGFPCINEDWRQRADWFKRQFENLLLSAVRLADGNISNRILNSNELITRFTIPAEEVTERLSGIPINTGISSMEQRLRSGNICRNEHALQNAAQRLNRLALSLLDGLIDFKESILREVQKQNLYTTNYPLLIRHILREAGLYRATISELLCNGQISPQSLCDIENFWNRIMMEHAFFIRGLLDPSEKQLIATAQNFALDYEELLNQAKQQDCLATDSLAGQSLTETIKYRDFKAVGTEGILNGTISSIILPLLADHVLREANHYVRILEQAKTKQY